MVPYYKIKNRKYLYFDQDHFLSIVSMNFRGSGRQVTSTVVNKVLFAHIRESSGGVGVK